jgi:hypothetical protein
MEVKLESLEIVEKLRYYLIKEENILNLTQNNSLFESLKYRLNGMKDLVIYFIDQDSVNEFLKNFLEYLYGYCDKK